ncbi:MAG: hypothetical protein JW787_10005 [Sedimentisphaerales bacterium]|nr:hypothetical protein [Sedimentisphaerales bacterium]
MAKFKPIGRKRKYIRLDKPEKDFKLMTQHYVDVLQNIEFCIVTAWRDDRDIDDRDTAAALNTIIRGDQTENSRVKSLISSLENARMLRPDVSDEIWLKGLKVVLESVHTHSDAKEGDTDYLEFASAFMP